MKNDYKCIKCKEVWGFCPEDYDRDFYPKICPLCDMPISQMIGDIWHTEGFRGIPLMVKILIAKVC